MAKPLEGDGRYFVGFRCRASRRVSAIWAGSVYFSGALAASTLFVAAVFCQAFLRVKYHSAAPSKRTFSSPQSISSSFAKTRSNSDIP